MKETISFKLNGKPIRIGVDSERMLLWVLRTDLGLTGAKFGCGEGFCGACTVLVNREAVRACQFPIKGLKGKEVLTIEGLAGNGKLHPLQDAFSSNDALQCGYCTSGMILTAYSLLLKSRIRPERKSFRPWMVTCAAVGHISASFRPSRRRRKLCKEGSEHGKEQLPDGPPRIH